MILLALSRGIKKNPGPGAGYSESFCFCFYNLHKKPVYQEPI